MAQQTEQKKLLTEIMEADAKDGLYKKQTAVEWFLENIQKVHKMDWDIVFFHAKEIEKEQLKDAYWNGTVDIDKKDALLEAEQYYNETYNNNSNVNL
jgi:3-methyladenine DNA glycosylase AlkD